ncbi:oligosaccharide flippase family protein [Cryobacterium soli]|jgi:lipopolysaccharide exporter|uniref:oligosaccharide flippase family protein n=1 Tax=Cryobacterium soli TaxID=2220095 RepID=UPI000E759DB7|nr:oligosaccharide flippase family protein [Cryobacterium soli]
MPVGPAARSTLEDRVRSGALWAAASTVGLRFANIAIMAFVARIVAPEAFGVFALAMVVQGVVVSLAELGVSSAILRSDLDPDTIAPTIATLSIVTSAGLAALMVIFAEPLAALLGSVDAAGPLRVMAVSVALVGPFAVPSAQIQREFRQDVVFRAAAIAFIPSSLVLVGLALVGDGAIAFAWSRVAAQLVSGIILSVTVKKRYWPGFRPDQLRMLIAFGLPLALANLLSQVLLNVDYVFVGRNLGVTETGLYALAFTICAWSTAVIGSVLNGIVQPAFSKVRHEQGDLADALYRATQTVALVAVMIGALTLALAEPLITTVYGSQWSAAAPALVVLSGYGIIFVICLLFANIIISTGRTAALFLVQVVALAALLPAMAAGVQWGGLVGVGLSHIVVTAGITFPLYLLLIRRSIARAPGVVFRALAWPGLAGGVAAASAWSVALTVPTAPLKLLIGGCVGALVYLVLTAPLVVRLLPPALARLRLVSGAATQLVRPAAWAQRRWGRV